MQTYLSQKMLQNEVIAKNASQHVNKILSFFLAITLLEGIFTQSSVSIFDISIKVVIFYTYHNQFKEDEKIILCEEVFKYATRPISSNQ
jgi:hypothetical protein